MKNNTQADIQLLHTPKFKDIVISVRFLSALVRKEALSRNLLSLMLQDRCQKYDTKNKVTAALDDLYGATIASRTLTYGKSHMLEFRCKALNEKFCATAHLEQQFELIHQFLFHPLLSEECFKESKDNMIDSIKRRLDKPSTYATNKAMSMMGKDTPLKDACLPSIDEVKDLTLNDVQQAWENMMHNNHITVQVQGEIDKDTISHYIHRFLPFEGTLKDVECEYLIHQNDVQTMSETRHIDQSMLVLVFETGIKASDPDFWKLRCANALFGQLPTSLLFQEVREKRSLCYSVYSSIMSYEGCMSISTGVSSERLEEAYDVIMEQFRRMQQGDFSDQDLMTAKIMLKDSVLSTKDDMSATLNFEYQNLLLNQNRTLNDPLTDIDNTTKEDVVRLFNMIKHKVTYTLKQEVSHEENC